MQVVIVRKCFIDREHLHIECYRPRPAINPQRWQTEALHADHFVKELHGCRRAPHTEHGNTAGCLGGRFVVVDRLNAYGDQQDRNRRQLRRLPQLSGVQP